VDDKKEKLIRRINEHQVSDNPDILETYSRDQSFVKPMKPVLVIKPQNTEEVQAVVKWANETNTPLVSVSSGSPHYYGDTVPGVAGAAIVDLSGMKRIISINRSEFKATIEPGVNFTQLQPEVAKHGLKLYMPLLPRPNKSVLASYLERQPTIVPNHNWSLIDPIQVSEIVWGSGDIQGGKSMPAMAPPLNLPHEDQPIPRRKGAFNIDWNRLVSGAQGTMGIVTAGSVKCSLLPKVRKLLFISAGNLEGLINCAYQLLKFRWGEELLILNNAELALMLGGGVEKVRAVQTQLPPWILLIGIAGKALFPAERVMINESEIEECAQQFGLRAIPTLAGLTGEQILDLMDQPSAEPHWKPGFRGGCEDIFFLTTLNRTPEFLMTMKSAIEECKFLGSDLGVYIQPQNQGTSCHCEFSLPFDPADQKEVAKVKDLSSRASKKLMMQKAYFSRPYGDWAKAMYDGNFTNTYLLKNVRNILDPHNILNPGKLCF
jgi:hypothetical protein